MPSPYPSPLPAHLHRYGTPSSRQHESVSSGKPVRRRITGDSIWKTEGRTNSLDRRTRVTCIAAPCAHGSMWPSTQRTAPAAPSTCVVDSCDVRFRRGDVSLLFSRAEWVRRIMGCGLGDGVLRLEIPWGWDIRRHSRIHPPRKPSLRSGSDVTIPFAAAGHSERGAGPQRVAWWGLFRW